MPFGTLTIGFDDSVLRPRPWTVMQAEWGSELLTTLPEGRVLEVGAGAGQIGLLTVAGHGRSLVSVDRSPAAAEWTRSNAAAHRIEVDVRCAAMHEALAPDETFVLITADPPWVPHAQVASFPEDPALAIDGGLDGLDSARECLQLIARHLHAEGRALLQLGELSQVRRLETEVGQSGLEVTEVRQATGGVVTALAWGG